VDEDLRANKKVFERTQQQIAIMPQSEMPPNDKLQAIAFQFNKDIENVKNALNDGLTDMNSPDAVERGFADFSKVSLAWNKLVARVNPYLKGQQTDPDFQAATAGDYNYVRQKLKDDLLQFFANGIQQINSFKQGIAAQGGIARVQNEASLVDILQQLGTGFYKNVRYGAEARTSLLIPRLPPDVGQQQGQPAAPQPPANPPAPQPQPIQPPARQPQITAGDIRLFDEYDQIHGQATPITDANAAMVAQTIENDMYNALPQARQRQITQQQRAGERQRIEALVPEMVLYIQLQQFQQQQQQQGQPAPPPQQQQGQQGQPAPAPPPPTPPRRGRPTDMNRQQAIFDKANELGIYQQLTGYSNKTQAERQRVAPIVRQLAAALQISPEALKRNLNQMVGFGMKGGFIGSLIADGLAGMAGDAYRGATGNSFSGDLFKLGKFGLSKFGDFLKEGRGASATQRGRPLRIANDFTGTQVVPNTLANLKNRYRGKSYIGTMTGDIDPTLQNSSVLGSARRRTPRMEGEGVAEVLASIGDMSRRTFYAILLPALRALGRAVISGAQLGRQIPPAIRDVFVRARGVYRREDVQTILSYLRDHPDVLIPFLPTPYAVSAVVLRLIQYWFNLPPSQQAPPQQGQQGQQPPQQGNINYAPNLPPPLQLDPEDEADGYVGVGNRGNGRCCFTSSMCNGTKAYRFKRGEQSANVRKVSVKGRGRMEGGGNGVDVNIKYSKLPKALQPTEEDLNPTPRPQSLGGGVRRRRMPKESYEGFQDQENDVYTHRGAIQDQSPLLHSEMLQDKALGLLKGLPRRLGVEDPKYKPQKQ
jgi:hypothetical protein